MNGNGDYASGDGFTFRGQGPIQVTGRDNFREIGDVFGIDLTGKSAAADSNRAELSDASRPELGFRASAYFFANHKPALRNPKTGRDYDFVKASSISRAGLSGTANQIADLVNVKDPASVASVNEAVTRAINGPAELAVADRLAFYSRALTLLAGDQSPTKAR